MAVITISREFGSEGNYIGTEVAKILGYRFVFKKEIGEVFERYGIHSFDTIYHAKANFWTQFDEVRIETMDFLGKVIQGFAQQGNMVIMGRCGYAILQGFADVLHVRIQAPLPIKVERIRQENLTVPDKVEDLIKQEDKNRADLLYVFYHVRWENTKDFDMVVNTGKVSPDSAVKWIVEAVKSIEARQDNLGQTTRTITVDPILSNNIAQSLSV